MVRFINSNLERKQYFGNMSLFIVLVFLCTAVLMPLQVVSAAPGAGSSVNGFIVVEADTFENEANREVNFQITLLRPVTSTYIDFITLDFFNNFTGTKTVEKVVYAERFDDYYKYELDWTYQLADYEYILNGKSQVFVDDNDGDRLGHIQVDTKIHSTPGY